MYCSRCGGEIPIGSKCPDCGNKQKRASFIWPFLAIVLFIFSAGLSYWSYNEINALKLSAELQVAEAHGRGYAEGEIQGHKAGYEEAYALAYDEGYTAGTNDTYDAAYQAGYDEGRDTGYDLGKNASYNQGYQDGLKEGFEVGSGKEYSSLEYFLMKDMSALDEDEYSRMIQLALADNSNNHPKQNSKTSGDQDFLERASVPNAKSNNKNYSEQKKAAYNEIMQKVDAATKESQSTVLSPKQFQELYDEGRNAGLSPSETIDAMTASSKLQNSEFEDLMAAAQAANANPDSNHAKESPTYKLYHTWETYDYSNTPKYNPAQ